MSLDKPEVDTSTQYFKGRCGIPVPLAQFDPAPTKLSAESPKEVDLITGPQFIILSN